MSNPDPLDSFSEPASTWFRETFGEPTPPQAQGWPPIQRGENTLILAPTGSGKTLAAFLWGIDEIHRESRDAQSHDRADVPDPRRASSVGPGVRLVYVSPLKALNNDIERNLRAPLAGIRAAAARTGQTLPPLRVAVRTGDTPPHVRAQMLRDPPHILITTPESLYLMLTSPRAREMFRATRTVIVDEIHTLCGNKRGVHLALSLERLQHLAGERLQRIGLSATVKPLDEAARFLGGQEWEDGEHAGSEGASRPAAEGDAAGGEQTAGPRLVARSVAIVDAGYQKPMDLQVVTPVDDFRDLPGNTIWPALIPRLLQDLLRHRSTLIFCNNRRLAERTADRLNAQIAAEQTEEIPPGSTEALAPGGIARDRGMFAIGAAGPIRAHHGSMSREARRHMEEELKAGRLPALVGTSSLELGIDVGAVDFVAQLQSPKSVAQGLQRVGRSGHLVGQTSVGRIYATFREDLVEAAAIARGMLEGDVEPTLTPRNALDVLAQQIAAMVAVEDWEAPSLLGLIRQSYPYQDLSLQAFRAVLDMLSGGFQGTARSGHASLRARIAWDRVNDRLAALPGTRLLAITNPGTISDTGAYDVYLADGKTRLGQLDEEFVYETRVGDAFLLGSNVWRVLDIQDDRIVVGDAAGATPRMPFWHGDYPWRSYELGLRIGRLRGELAAKIRDLGDDRKPLVEWLKREYVLDESSARNLLAYVERQLDAGGAIATDRALVVESFADAVGDARLVLHSPFGGRVNGAWALAITSAVREAFGIHPETQVSDDGILLRLPGTQAPQIAGGAGRPDLLRLVRLAPAEARRRILGELPGSALFGAHFRMNAARALLLPRARGRKRTPFWLQRLKAKDLLASVRDVPDFPLVDETYRDCLRDVLDLAHLEVVLTGLQSGSIALAAVETAVPSPVAAALLNNFASTYMYEWDAPKAERQLQALALGGNLLADLLQMPGADGTGSGPAAALLKPEAITEVVDKKQHKAAGGYQARSAEELAVHLRELGDLTAEEVAARCAGDTAAWLVQLVRAGRVTQIDIPAGPGRSRRWVPVELAIQYEQAFSVGQPEPAEAVLLRFLHASGPVTRAEILQRYAFDSDWLDDVLERLVMERMLVRGQFRRGADPAGTSAGTNSGFDTANAAAGPEEYCVREIVEQVYRRTLTLLRSEAQPVSLFSYADFLARRQGIGGPVPAPGIDGLRRVLEVLRGVEAPGLIWERDILPARLKRFDPEDLDHLCRSGEIVWVAAGKEARRCRVRFFGRGDGRLFLDIAAEARALGPEPAVLSELARAALAYLKAEGASYLADLQIALTDSRTGAGSPNTAGASLRSALVELALAGLVTGDSLSALDAILQHDAEPGGPRAPLSSLEAELAARSSRRPLTRGRYHAAKLRVAARLQGESDQSGWEGRWSPVYRAAILGPSLDVDERARRLARVLLARYGVVAHDIVAFEASTENASPGGAVDWPSLAGQLHLMELRAEVRRGYFVAGMSGVQYGLPDAVEDLRAVGQSASQTQAPIVLNAADPANIFAGDLGAAGGYAEPGLPRFARVPSTYCVLRQGRPVLVAEDNGRRLTATGETNLEAIGDALQAWLQRPNAPRHTVVAQWNGAPVLGSPGEPLLRALGFYRMPTGLERWGEG